VDRRYDEAYAALGTVIDPELDESITDLGFVRSLVVTPGSNVKVHLRLPTSFCAPNFAYLMASDAKDVLTALDWTRTVVVELDDHHDSDIINAGLAADAGYRGTYGQEAEESLDELRITFRRKAHTAAVERCLTALLRREPGRAVETLGEVRLAELPDDATTRAPAASTRGAGSAGAPGRAGAGRSRRARLPPDEVPLALRRARSTRISIEGNAHFCRGLLRTRYPDAGAFVPLSAVNLPV
jgi:metal-sulfur cluster biosynthetic enzyme